MCRFSFKRFEKIGEYKETKYNKISLQNSISTKLPNPIRETRVLKLVFITIQCLKFWALVFIHQSFRNKLESDKLARNNDILEEKKTLFS